MFSKMLVVIVIVAALWYAHDLGMTDGVVKKAQTVWNATSGWFHDMFYPESTVVDAFNSKSQRGYTVVLGTGLIRSDTEE